MGRKLWFKDDLNTNPASRSDLLGAVGAALTLGEAVHLEEFEDNSGHKKVSLTWSEDAEAKEIPEFLL